MPADSLWSCQKHLHQNERKNGPQQPGGHLCAPPCREYGVRPVAGTLNKFNPAARQRRLDVPVGGRPKIGFGERYVHTQALAFLSQSVAAPGLLNFRPVPLDAATFR